eukprot:m.77416 g.77416  ORF g.77416 m.77416 type:complete len:490 (+) comp7915_c1_seq2:51-1520(+)
MESHSQEPWASNAVAASKSLIPDEPWFERTRVQRHVYILLALVLGSFYSSASYLARIKDLAELSQAEINGIGAAAYIGACAFTIVGGTVNDRYPDHARLFLSALIACGCVGYTGLYAFLTFDPTGAGPVLLGVFLALVGLSTVSYCTIAGIMVVRISSETERNLLNGVLSAAFGLGGMLMIVLFKYEWDATDVSPMFLGLAVVHAVMALAGPLFVSFPREYCQEARRARAKKKDSIDDLERHPLISQQSHAIQDPDNSSIEHVVRKYVLSVPSALCNTSLFLLMGVLINHYNNMGNQMQARGGSASDIGMIALVFQIAQTVGRFAATLLPPLIERVAWLEALSTPIFFMSAVVFCGLANGLALVDGVHVLYASLCIAGLGYGIMWTIFLPLILFTFPHLQENQFGKMFGVMQLAVAFAPLLFDLVSGTLYDREADTDSNCTGSKCYFWTYVIGCTCAGIVAVLVLTLTRMQVPRVRAAARAKQEAAPAT